MNSAACTIVSPNYLAFARTLADSYLAQHPGNRFFVLIVADLTDPAPFAGHAFTPVMLPDIGLQDLRAEAMKYDILELNTNVKPAFMRHLLATYSLDTLVYLDPDIFCYAPLTPVFDELQRGATAVLTPHLTTPIYDGLIPGEQDLLINGTYNLGFIAVRNCPEALRLLEWWDARCLDAGFAEGRSGLFVDQKWINLAPGLFADVAITRHAGCNMAYWNLHERTLSAAPSAYTVHSPVSGDVPLCFYHFSGIVPDDPAILSRHTKRFSLATRPDLAQLFADYKAAVIANRTPSRKRSPTASISSLTAPPSPPWRVESTLRISRVSPGTTPSPPAAHLLVLPRSIASSKEQSRRPRPVGKILTPATVASEPFILSSSSSSVSSARTSTSS